MESSGSTQNNGSIKEKWEVYAEIPTSPRHTYSLHMTDCCMKKLSLVHLFEVPRDQMYFLTVFSSSVKCF